MTSLPPTASEVAAHAGLHRATVSKVLAGYSGVGADVRTQIAEALTDLGGDPTLIPKPGTAAPTPRPAPLSDVEQRARRSARQAAWRAKRDLLERAGMSDDELALWLHERLPRATRWQTVALWTDPALSEILAAAEAMADQRESDHQS